MGENTGEAENYNIDFNIDEELSTLLQQQRLPQRILEKLVQKIKDNNIQLTKEQFYQIIDRLEQTLQSTDSGKKILHASSPYYKTEWDESQGKTSYHADTQDMHTLVESIEELKKKISYLEKNQVRGSKGVTGRLVHTKDIHTGPAFDAIQPLEGIPNDPESIVVVMKWLQYLVDRLGLNKLPDVLDYYVDIDWISDDVRLDLIRYSKGITEIQPKEGMTSLSTKEHIQSLLYIQKLKGVQLDERFLWRIDREIEKLGKSINEYQFK